MPSDDMPKDLQLTQTQLRDIIERAARAEPRAHGVTVPELRQIAEELDIDPWALEQALHDVVGLPYPGRPIRSWLHRQVTRLGHLCDQILPQRARLGSGILVGGFLGALSALASVSVEFTVDGTTYSRGGAAIMAVPIAVAMILLILANSLSRRLDGRLGRFLAESASMQISSGVSAALVIGSVTDDLVTWTLTMIVGATIWGLLVVRRHHRGPPLYSVRAPITVPQPTKPHDPDSRPLAKACWSGLVSPTMLGVTRQ